MQERKGERSERRRRTGGINTAYSSFSHGNRYWRYARTNPIRTSCHLTDAHSFLGKAPIGHPFWVPFFFCLVSFSFFLFSFRPSWRRNRFFNQLLNHIPSLSLHILIS